MARLSLNVVDALLDRQLKALLRQWRGEGRGTREIRDLINDRLPKDVEISHSTVARYCQILEIPKGKKRRAA